MTHKNLKKMQKMEEILQVILESEDIEPSLKEISSRFGYHSKSFERLFAEYFEIPYAEFIRKLRLRRVAREMIQSQSTAGLWEKYHYSSHSNFIRMFRKEFGLTPKKFLDTRMDVPEMPRRTEILGMKIQMEYRHMPKTSLRCKEILSPKDFTVARRMVIPEGDYTIFSLQYPDIAKDLSLYEQMLIRYAFLEWQPLEEKRINPRGRTFEFYTQDTIYLYVPFLAGVRALPKFHGEAMGGSESWAPYIDAHIWENLSPESIAEKFHYSAKHFVRVFHLVYSVTPMKYINKRRLYLTSEEIRKHPAQAEKICQKRGYHSVSQFEQAYQQEFFILPMIKENAENAGNEYRAIDVMSYYKDNRSKLLMHIQKFPAMVINGTILTSQDTEDESDLPGQAAAAFLRGAGEHASPAGIYASAWYEERTGNSQEIEYVLGPASPSDPSEPEISAISGISETRRLCALSEGTYAVFETDQEVDEDENLAETFSMMNRVVFYGWIIKNRSLWDGSRITFTMYVNRDQNGQKKKKLYFCVPVLTPVIP